MDWKSNYQKKERVGIYSQEAVGVWGERWWVKN